MAWPQVVGDSERPEIWDALTGLSGEVWPRYSQDGATLNQYWGQFYEVFPAWQFALYYPGQQTVLARGSGCQQPGTGWPHGHGGSRRPARLGD